MAKSRKSVFKPFDRESIRHGQFSYFFFAYPSSILKEKVGSRLLVGRPILGLKDVLFAIHLAP